MITKLMTGKQKLTKANIEYLRKDDDISLKKTDTEYLRKDNTLYLGGFINTRARQQGFSKASTSEQNKIIEDIFNDIIEKNKESLPTNGVGIRHVCFSPDPKKIAHLSRDEQEQLIVKSIKDTMKKFKDNYYKGDSIGFCFSVHRDKDHMHGHVYFSTFTEHGKYISMNSGLHRKSKKGHDYVNTKKAEDKLKFLKTVSENSFNKEIKRSLIKGPKHYAKLIRLASSKETAFKYLKEGIIKLNKLDNILFNSMLKNDHIKDDHQSKKLLLGLYKK